MTTYTIANEYISLAAKTIGAEWCSLKAVKTGKEYMWQADPTYWGRHSCILFPIIGAVKDHEIEIGGQRYAMKKHGLVRDLPFEMVQQTRDSVTFLFRSNDQTRPFFPFEFSLEAHYSLSAYTASVRYTVNNEQNSEMYFSLGGHPAFNCPLYSGEKRSDYSLVFNRAEDAETQLLDSNGLRTSTRKVVLQHSDTISITDHLFDEDALIFHNLRSNEVSLVNAKGQKMWTFDFTGFTHLGIWSKNQQSPYVCIEPWFGWADPVDPPASFKDKEGIVKLASGKSLVCTHQFTLHDR